MTTKFSTVAVSSPPRITPAMGLWISLPGWSPFSASGIRAAQVSCQEAVISQDATDQPVWGGYYFPEFGYHPF